MNWTGGSRNRVNIRNAKKNLEDFSELEQSRQTPERCNTSNPNVHGNKSISQDIIFLNMLMSQPPTPLGRKVTHLHLKTPKKMRGWQTCNIDLPASPPSKLPKLETLFPEIVPSICTAETKDIPLEKATDIEANQKRGMETVHTQTKIKTFIDVGVQTEDLHSERNQIDDDN